MRPTIDSDAAPDPIGDGTVKPPCTLVGEDGNVFNVIGRVKRALQQAGQVEQAREFVRKAFAAKSYDEVLGLCMEYVDVR